MKWVFAGTLYCPVSVTQFVLLFFIIQSSEQAVAFILRLLPYEDGRNYVKKKKRLSIFNDNNEQTMQDHFYFHIEMANIFIMYIKLTKNVPVWRV